MGQASSFQVRRGLSLIVALAGLLIGAAVRAKAQSYLENIGVPPFTTKLPIENGFINAANGNLHLEIPLGSFPQRGGPPEKVVLMYDSAIWLPWQGKWNPYNTPSYTFNYINSGWRLVTSGDSGTTTAGQTYSGYCSAEDDYYWDTYSPWIYVAPDGTQHAFPASVQTVAPIYPGICGTNGSGTPNASGYASDGSGFYISVTNYTNATVYAPDGTVNQIAPYGGGSIKTDSNGNQYKITTPNDLPQLFDTLGRAIVTETVSSDGTTVYYAVPNAQGGTSTYAAKMASIPVSTNFGQSGILEDSQNIRIITELDLPDGTKYTFSYDSGTTAGHYGLLTGMALPTGDTIQYSYSVYQDGNSNRYLWTTSRTNPDGTWAYVPQTPLSNCASGYVDCQQQVKITKASGDQSVYTFTLNGGAWPTQLQYYTGSSILLATTTQCFSFVGLNSSGGCTYNITGPGAAATNVHLSAQTTTLPIPGGKNVSATTEYSWDGYGNLTQISEWNFGSSPSNAADRITYISYLNGSSYISANILNRPQEVDVAADASTIQRTIYSYDGSSLISGAVSGCAAVTGSANHDDSNYGTGNNVRGNLTQIQQMIYGPSTFLTSSMTYDITGQLRTSTDSNLNATSYCYEDNLYDDSGGNPPNWHSVSPATNAYLTSITAPLTSGSMSFGHYYGTGQLAYSNDANGAATYFHFADLLNRPTATSLPDGGWTLTQYPSASENRVDTYSGITTTTPTANCPSSNTGGCRQDETLLDGLGRVTSQNLVNDPEGQTLVATAYDPNGRVHSITNPYRTTGDYTYGLETNAYDGMDRLLSVTRADGSVAHTYYGAAASSSGEACSGTLGYPIVTIDEAGNKRQVWIDGFGRTIEADEPDSSNNLTVSTCYSYDANNNLIQVAQGSETRTYSYDMLSRLTSESTPESGPTTSNGTTYFYHTTSSGGLCSGNPNALCRRTDARNTTTTYSYDALNRLVSKTYSDGTPSVGLAYDQSSVWGNTLQNPLGRLTFAQTGATVTADLFSYDPMGRVKKHFECVPRTCGYELDYTYDLAGDMTSSTNGLGVTISYGYDSTERPMTVTSNLTDAQHPATLATLDPTFGYYPIGAMRVMTLGNGLTQSSVYEPRSQACRINVNSSGTFLGTCGDSQPNGNIQDFAYAFGTWGSSNNGNITSWNGTGTRTFSRTYTYDYLNRLSSLSSPNDPSGCTGYSWTYDRWGNRLSQNPSGGTNCAPSQLIYATNKNQITSSRFQYDTAGNLTNDTVHTYSYDAENRITQVDGTPGNCSTATACYVYDFQDRRISKTTAAGTIESLYDLAGNTVTELNASWSWTNSYVYLAGNLLTQYSGGSSGNAYFVHPEHLGSARLLTTYSTTQNQNQQVYDSLDYFPFGEQMAGGNSTSHKFTGYERDSETDPGNGTGNDYAFARYYSSRNGSFMSADPGPSNLADPQSLNRYPYVRNNPVTLTDPSGMDPFCDPEDPTCGGCDIFCFGPIGGGGGGGGIGPQPPIYIPPGGGTNPNPSNGTLTSDDPFGGETNGIPNGLQIPALGLPGLGCTYGGGSCGGMINSWTAEGGFSIQITVWGLAIQGFYGLAIDQHLHLAIYRGGGGGIGLGAKVSTGISVSASNGNSVCALGGPFTNVSGTAGAGAGGTVDVFTGKGDAPGGMVWGAGGTIGPTLGAAGGVTITATNVHPLGKHRCADGKIE